MNNDELKKVIKDHLDEESDSAKLDQQLVQARKVALDRAHQPSILSGLLKPVSISAFVTASVLIAVFSLLNHQPEIKNKLETVSDIEMLTSEDNLEFYEDLEFYEWLLLEDQRSS